jgi:hypothetical protein
VPRQRNDPRRRRPVHDPAPHHPGADARGGEARTAHGPIRRGPPASPGEPPRGRPSGLPRRGGCPPPGGARGADALLGRGTPLGRGATRKRHGRLAKAEAGTRSPARTTGCPWRSAAPRPASAARAPGRIHSPVPRVAGRGEASPSLSARRPAGPRELGLATAAPSLARRLPRPMPSRLTRRASGPTNPASMSSPSPIRRSHSRSRGAGLSRPIFPCLRTPKIPLDPPFRW